MNILLLHPPAEEDLLFKKIIGLTPQPIGLGYIAAATEKNGHKVDILDIPAEDISKRQYILKLKEFKPDVVGIYLATYRHKKGKEYLQLTKKFSEDIFTVCGGPHSSVTAEDLAEEEFIDFVVSGEGEKIFPELLSSLDNEKSIFDVKGIVFKEDNEIISTEPPEKIRNLDQLPKPARHLFDMEKYTLMNTLNIASIVSSRGCPSDCNYCTVPAVFGTECRLRTAKNIVDEIEDVNERYGPDFFMFMDDNFDYDIDRLWRICELIEERNLDINWGCCSGGINSDKPDLLKEMRESGCKVLSYNLESGSKKSIEVMESTTTHEKTKKDLELADKHDLIKILNVIIGMPGEGEKDILESIEFAKEVKTEFPLFFLPTPYPGTKFYDTAKRQGMIEEMDWKKYTSYNPVIKNNSLSKRELRNLLNKAYKECYLDKSSLMKRTNMLLKRIVDRTVSIRDIPFLMNQYLKSINYVRKL